MDKVYCDRIVAFIDILGFKGLVRRLETEPAFHQNLQIALAKIRFYKNLTKGNCSAQNKLEASIFSDSIVISGASDNLHGVMWSAIHLQCDLLALGILIRGGIARGRTVHADDMLYGQGMLDAYNLESKMAIYPRIVLDPKLVSETVPNYRAAFLAQDVDGLWFIDPFSMGISPDDVDAQLDDGSDPHKESLKSLGNKIDQELLGLTDLEHITKWNWLKNRHAIAVLEFTKFGKPRFWHFFQEAAEARKQLPIVLLSRKSLAE